MTLSAIPVHVATESGVAPEMQKEILRIVAGIEYGSVEIVIHGRQVVQIETRQKRRFETNGKPVR